MSRFVRASKVRHLFGETPKKEFTYQNLKLSTATGDHNYIQGNTKFFGVPISSGGGALAVIKHGDFGKLSAQPPCLDGHKGAVLDFAFNPFHESIICTGGDDAHVMVWGIPAEGLTTTTVDPLVDLKGHQRKITSVLFHPSAEHVCATGSADNLIKLWDIEKGLSKVDVKDHNGVILDLAWNYDGSTLVTSCKDKMMRLVDPRTGVTGQEFEAHQGSKTAKMVCLGDTTQLCSVGFTRQSKRQLKLWDTRKLDKDLTSLDIDQAAGVLMPFYDADINVLFLAGKGDGNVRYFEIVDDEPWQFFISEYKANVPCRGMAMLPKRICDTSKCEVTRLLKLESSGVSPISFTIPRKSDLFQEDIYPDAISAKPANTADAFFSGTNKKPILMSMDPEKRPAEDNAAAKEFVAPKDIGAELEKAEKRIAELEALLTKNKIALP